MGASAIDAFDETGWAFQPASWPPRVFVDRTSTKNFSASRVWHTPGDRQWSRHAGSVLFIVVVAGVADFSSGLTLADSSGQFFGASDDLKLTTSTNLGAIEIVCERALIPPRFDFDITIPAEATNLIVHTTNSILKSELPLRAAGGHHRQKAREICCCQ